MPKNGQKGNGGEKGLKIECVKGKKHKHFQQIKGSKIIREEFGVGGGNF